MSQHVILYQQPVSSIQSGPGTQEWILEHVTDAPRVRSGIMRWTGSADTTEQIRCTFPSRAEGLAYCKQHGYHVAVMENARRRYRPKSYAANFAHARKQAWTH